MIIAPDGVTRQEASTTPGQSLNVGLNADGSFSRSSIYSESRPPQSLFDGEAPSSGNSLFLRVQSDHFNGGSGRTDRNEG